MARPGGNELDKKITWNVGYWLIALLLVLLAGLAAEKLVFGLLSTGAADGLAKANDIARDMVTRYGMDEDLGFVAFEPQRQQQMLDLPPGLASHGAPVSQKTQIYPRSMVFRHGWPCTVQNFTPPVVKVKRR